ncbi:LOW QUALITY PROTEIN: hypothetical protein MAR_002165 [Mya arenaria]|uniref:Uncharacterized protein n=1 Tax=Mya arenaria TaxID=6604 RepID=A0ABY7FFF8_MYAAR|nr:LOW QUALITY PROTEIN: hypothetical protein MAR_002165 [Mya arenaria]
MLYDIPRQSNDERYQALGMLQAGAPKQDIAIHFNCDLSAIKCLSLRARMTGAVYERPRAGRSRITTAKEDRILHFTHLRDRFMPATKVAYQIVDKRSLHLATADGTHGMLNVVNRCGSVHFWGGISRFHKTPLVILIRNVTAVSYVNDVLQQDNGILPQDHARPHNARLTMNFLQANLFLIGQQCPRTYLQLNIFGMSKVDVFIAVFNPRVQYLNSVQRLQGRGGTSHKPVLRH